VRNEIESALAYIFDVGFEVFYNPKDGGDTFLRNVGYHSTHYTASYLRRRYSFIFLMFAGRNRGISRTLVIVTGALPKIVFPE
jgi:hypothetical protein